MSNPIPDSRYQRMLRRGLLGIAVASGAALLALGWARYSGPSPRHQEKLVIAHASQPAFALIYIASAKGYFREAGLDVALQPHALGRDALTSVVEGKADLATAHETPVVKRIYEGNALGIISTLHTSAHSQALLARRDSGISTAADLKGKRIGVTPGTSMEFMLHLLLTTEGVPASSVTKVSVEPADYESAIDQKRVDALVVFGPYLHALQEKFGRDQLAVLRSDLYIETSMLAGMRDKLLAKPLAMQRFLKAIVRAQEFTQSNPGESLEIVIKQLAERYPEVAVRNGWSDLKFVVELDNLMLTLLTQQARWLRDTGVFSTTVPDFRDFIVAEFLHDVKPGAATLHTRND